MMNNTKNIRTRMFCFTDFLMDISFWNTYCKDYEVDYLIIGQELCPSTGKKHLQGFIYFKNARSFLAIIKSVKPRHIEICKGNIDQNIKYCSKDNNIELEYGIRPSQGKRTDINDIKNEIVNGKKLDEIVLENPIIYHKYGRTLSKIEDLCMRKKYRTDMTVGIWYYGSTGVGKSHKAFENYNPNTHYIHNINDNGWWDSYTQQNTVIINEFRGQISYSDLLDIVDKWPKTVKRRNREPIPFISKTVIITSSEHPRDVYCNLSKTDSLEQLYRRFSIINVLSRNNFIEMNTNKIDTEVIF